MQEHLEILGKKIRDRVTGLKGVATSVSFDLFGCVQVILNPGLDKDGKQMDGSWFDITRLEITDEKRVMEPPDFFEGERGPESKPVIL